MKGAIVQITTACNLRCKACNSYSLKPKFMEFRRDYFVHLKKQGFWYLSLTGGEPTLHPQIEEMLKNLKQLGLFTHIATNGSNPDKIRALIPYLDAITISLDHFSAEVHDKLRERKVFEKAIESAKAVKGRVKIASLNMLVCDENAEHVLEMASFANKELGLPLSLCFPDNSSYLYNQNFEVSKERLRNAFYLAWKNYRKFVFANTREFYKQALAYIDGKKVSKCKAGKRIFYIDVNGKIMACFKFEKAPPGCNQCFIQCFREPSLFNPLRDAGMFIRAYLKGKIG